MELNQHLSEHQQKLNVIIFTRICVAFLKTQPKSVSLYLSLKSRLVMPPVSFCQCFVWRCFTYVVVIFETVPMDIANHFAFFFWDRCSCNFGTDDLASMLICWLLRKLTECWLPDLFYGWQMLLIGIQPNITPVFSRVSNCHLKAQFVFQI